MRTEHGPIDPLALGLAMVLAATGACTVTTGARGTLGFGYREADAVTPPQLGAALATGEEIDVVVYAAKSSGEPSNDAMVMGKRAC